MVAKPLAQGVPHGETGNWGNTWQRQRDSMKSHLYKFLLQLQKRKRDVEGTGSKQRSTTKPKSMDTVSDKVFHYPRHIRKFRPQDLDDVIKLTEAKIRHVDLKTKEWDLAYKMKHNREPIPVPENPY